MCMYYIVDIPWVSLNKFVRTCSWKYWWKLCFSSPKFTHVFKSFVLQRRTSLEMSWSSHFTWVFSRNHVIDVNCLFKWEISSQVHGYFKLILLRFSYVTRIRDLVLNVDMPILTCIFITFNWLTLTSEMHFVKFHPAVASCLLSRGKRKYAPLGMRLLWKYIRNYFLVYQ